MQEGWHGDDLSLFSEPEMTQVSGRYGIDAECHIQSCSGLFWERFFGKNVCARAYARAPRPRIFPAK